MSSFLKLLIILLYFVPFASSEEVNGDISSDFKEPIYTPFVERYILDELKSIRLDQAKTKNELIEKIVDREHMAVDRAVSYATDTVTYFFYLIATATSILVVVGWKSMTDIKEKAHSLADKEISKLVSEYEERLVSIENLLQQKTMHIEENREEIELTQEVQSLWLRVQQDSSPVNIISTLDEILKLRPNDVEALTYKADAVLELNELQWAVNLCAQALSLDSEYPFALYQMACAKSLMGAEAEAIQYLTKALKLQPSYVQEIEKESSFIGMKENLKFLMLVEQYKELPVV